MRTTKGRFFLLLLMAMVCCMTAANTSASRANLFPETGSWYNPQAGDKTGLNLEVQNGTLSGAYYGYDGYGDQVWLLFSGPLRIDRMGHFVFSGQLTRSSGGGCIIDCNAGNNNAGHSVESVGMIDIEFTGRTTGRFRVNGNEFQTIRALSYGTSAEAAFPEFPDQMLPNFNGTWAIDYIFHFFCSNPESATIFNIFEQPDGGNPMQVRYRVDETFTGPSLFVVPDMQGQTANIVQPKNDPLAGLLAGDGNNNLNPAPQCTPPAYTFFTSGELVCEVVEDEDQQSMPVCIIRANEEVPLEMDEFMFKFFPDAASDSRIGGQVLLRWADSENFHSQGSFSARRMYYD